MNHDERFEQRWEFRRKEVDGYTSSDDNGSNSSGDPANRNHKLVTDLVLVENDEDPECEIRHEKVEETKNEPNKKLKKKQGLQKKKLEVNGNKRKRKVNTNEKVTLKDLKMFADSLIHELSVTRENMFAHMREEMRKSTSSKSSLLSINKTVKQSQNVEANKFPKAVAQNKKKEPRRTNTQQKGDKLRPSDTNHRLVSSSNIPLPNPQFQIQTNGLTNGHIPQGVPKDISSGLEIEIRKSFSHRIPKFQPQELLGSFSHNHQKSSVGLLGQNNCIQGIGFPIPLIQGTSNGSNTSSLTYCENSFVDNNGVGVRMNASFPAGWS